MTKNVATVSNAELSAFVQSALAAAGFKTGGKKSAIFVVELDLAGNVSFNADALNGTMTITQELRDDAPADQTAEHKRQFDEQRAGAVKNADK